MDLLGYALAIAVAALAGYVILVAVGALGTPEAPKRRPRPASGRDEALARLRELQALDGPEVADAGRTVLIEPQGEALATIVYFHGFTNCPNQFRAAADVLASRGYRVLVPRQPRHGFADVLTRELAGLTSRELTDHVDAVMDIAAGFDGDVRVIGLSGGGILAYWAAALRPELTHVVAASPSASPTGIPVPLARLLVRFRRFVPAIYWWWDPRKKADLGESPYVYPGFPLPGLIPYLHLANLLGDRKVRPITAPRQAILLSNPNDFAVRKGPALRLMHRTFDGVAETVAEVALAKELGWWHDFIDPDGSHHGEPEEVADVILAALDLAERTAGGRIASDGRPSLAEGAAS